MTKNQNSPADTIRQISQHQAALLAYVLTLHPDRSEAQDILQETNVVLWQKIDEFRDGTNFKAWAFRIAYHRRSRISSERNVATGSDSRLNWLKRWPKKPSRY
jgi:RNA polymerase sigma-70 factor (ECF subfamily)